MSGSAPTWVEVVAWMGEILDRLAKKPHINSHEECACALDAYEYRMRRIRIIAGGIKRLRENGRLTPTDLQHLLALEEIL